MLGTSVGETNGQKWVRKGVKITKLPIFTIRMKFECSKFLDEFIKSKDGCNCDIFWSCEYMPEVGHIWGAKKRAKWVRKGVKIKKLPIFTIRMKFECFKSLDKLLKSKDGSNWEMLMVLKYTRCLAHLSRENQAKMSAKEGTNHKIRNVHYQD